MVSNAKVRGLTTIPASLSYQVVTGELRDALGFKGLIVTDSPSAKAITDPPLAPFNSESHRGGRGGRGGRR
jgi:beta-glucosidase-like glycosyl hydrolase